MIVGEVIHGFEVLRESNVNELNATMYELKHLKTHLKLAWLKRSEENKTFGIAFKTLPTNDTGVFHILEHSLLCGSKNYPVKEPFVELMKNSMSTFLNALTFPDKTFYPVSSRNDKDFINLMKVYMDAVFYPAIYEKKEIFLQEGWHYELDNNELYYKGVVLNEMKGSFASPYTIMNTELKRQLFKDTCYSYVYGGYPTEIVKLTYEDFISTHKKYYSPSNGYIFLDGDIDIEVILQILNDEYLTNMNYTKEIKGSVRQVPIHNDEVVVEYEIGENEKEEDKYRVAWGRVIGTYNESEKLLAMKILSDVLCGNNQAPLNKEILDKGLAENVFLQVNDSQYQNWCDLEVCNLKEENIEEVQNIIRNVLKEQVRNGIDPSRLEASMASLEFQFKERDYGNYPQGIILGFQVLESWLYGGRPEANLEVGHLFDSLRNKINEGYFEKLIQDVFFENDHYCKVILKPSNSLGKVRRQKECDSLNKELSNWNEEDIKNQLKKQELLYSFQNEPDSKENIEKLPILTLGDLKREPEDLPTEVVNIDNITVLKHNIDSNGINYYTLYFDLYGLSEEELSTLSFVCELLGNIQTENYSANQLASKIRLLCGSLQFYISSYEGKDSDKYKVKFCASFSALEKNKEEALNLALEILTNSKIEDEKAILDIIRQTKVRLFQNIIMNGHNASVRRVFAQVSGAGVADECANGIAFYQWIKSNEEQWNFNQLRSKLNTLYKQIIIKDNLCVSATGNIDEGLSNMIKIISTSIPLSYSQKSNIKLKPWGRQKEGIVIPSDVSFASRGGYMEYSSNIIPLASRIVTLAYLWNTIRVQGGAYGTGVSITNSGFTCCYSFRDPDGHKSLNKYLDCGSFLNKYCNDEVDLTGFIIGTVSSLSPLRMPRNVGNAADSFYWREISYKSRQENYKAILSSKPEELREVARFLEQSIYNGGVCVIGGLNQLEKCKLEKIIKL